METTWHCSCAIWEEISSKTNRSIVYIDDACAEMLHWQGGMKRLLDAGAKDVREFSSFERAAPEEKKAVFIVSQLLKEQVTGDVLHDIIEQSSFQYVMVITTASTNVHVFDRTGNADSDEKKDFEEMEDTLLQWMGNMNFTVEIFHYPLFTADIAPGFFVTPGFASMFPLLDTDVQHIQLQYNASNRAKTDKVIFDSLSEIDSHHLPKSLQVAFKKFACCLHGLLSDLGVREDLYSIGHTSRMLATEVESYAPARTRRKSVPQRASVVLIDRTLDLMSSTSHQFENLLDKMVHTLPSLPRHKTDILINMSPLCSLTQECERVMVPGSLASDQLTSQPTHLNPLITSKHKDGLMDVNRRLVEATTKEKLPVNLTGRPGRINAEQLDSVLSVFRGNYKAIQPHIDALQVAMATSQTLKHPASSHHDNLLSTEKSLIQLLGDDNSASGLAHVLALLDKQLKLPANERSHSLDDILLTLVFLYSLSGGDCGSEEEEEQLQELMVKTILAEREELPTITKAIVGDATSAAIIRDLVEDVWGKLRALGGARDHLKQFQSLLEPGNAVSPASAKPLLKTIVEEVFNPEKPELLDIEFKSSGIKDLLKSGFGLFRSVAKPRPSDHRMLLLFVVGGITATEVKQIRDVLDKLKPSTRVMIGSTRLLRDNDVLQQVFCCNNLDPGSLDKV